MFIVSVATAEPTFIDESHLAVSLGNTVLAVQNKQEHIYSDFLCGKSPVTMNGRNPLADILSAVAAAVGGLSPGHVGHRGEASATVTDLDDAKATGVGGRLNDWSSFCGRSPVYSIITTSAYPSFSQLDLVILIEI